MIFRMKRSVCSYLISCFILSYFHFDGIDACWGGVTDPKFGVMTRDYDLLVGSELVLNCTLNKRSFPDQLPRNISSSDLVIRKGRQEFSKFTEVLDDRTIQLRIPNATVNDTGLYICAIIIDEENKLAVCSTKVDVGYPAHPVQNFSCISRNFDTLNCSWNTEKNKVFTTYTIVRNLMNIPTLQQKCPDNSVRSNSCEWTTKTNPIFVLRTRYISFTVTGTNSLGKIVSNFVMDSYSIVIPNSPENLETVHVGQQSVTIKWKPPTMNNLPNKGFSLHYQIRITKDLNDSSDFMVHDSENSTTEFTLGNLIPYVEYNVSVRCRSVHATNGDMWSDFTSLKFKTLPDVPYKIPEVIPEAFELQIYEDSRSATLYWKVVPKLYHNGEEFHYHIKYYQNDNSNTSIVHFLNTNITFINVKKLQKNSSYVFHIYSANDKGTSKDYGSIFIDSEAKIPPAPKEVSVISQDSRYNLTWVPPNDIDTFSYIVFWCSSPKPRLSRCDSSIHWTEERVSQTNIVLNLTDIKINFQFAVAAKTETSSSGMKWASCILTHTGGLSKIKYVYVEQKSSTAMKIIWNLDCPAEKAVLSSYRITYCEVDKHKECQIAEVEPNADNFLLENLHPFTNYSIKIRAISKHNKASEDSDEVYQSTLPEVSGMFIGMIVGAAIGAAVFLIFAYQFVKRMKLKIDEIKSFTVILPLGLEGPETNPLDNYKSFKNGHNGNISLISNEKLSHVIDVNENRYASGR